MRVLLTNDDGIDAPGLGALYAQLASLGEVAVVAPAKVQSAMSHSVTFHRPVEVTRREVSLNGLGTEAVTGFEGWAVDGRPADCVKLAMTHVLEEWGRPDLVVSGMNAGANVGLNVLYSGTVAAAVEAAFIGVPAIAVSLHLGEKQGVRWKRAAELARRAIDLALDGPMHGHTAVNINVPILDRRDDPEGIAVVPVETSPTLTGYAVEHHEDGRSSYAVNSALAFADVRPDTDVHALFAGYTTVTPLQFDLTGHGKLDAWRAHLALHG
ncbi:MAG: 5'/3'-nucleotidase SurE [Planctomycetota bacterium]